MSDNIYDHNIFKSIPVDEKMLWILKTNRSSTQRLSFLDPASKEMESSRISRRLNGKKYEVLNP